MGIEGIKRFGDKDAACQSLEEFRQEAKKEGRKLVAWRSPDFGFRLTVGVRNRKGRVIHKLPSRADEALLKAVQENIEAILDRTAEILSEEARDLAQAARLEAVEIISRSMKESNQATKIKIEHDSTITRRREDL